MITPVDVIKSQNRAAEISALARESLAAFDWFRENHEWLRARHHQYIASRAYAHARHQLFEVIEDRAYEHLTYE